MTPTARFPRAPEPQLPAWWIEEPAPIRKRFPLGDVLGWCGILLGFAAVAVALYLIVVAGAL